MDKRTAPKKSEYWMRKSNIDTYEVGRVASERAILEGRDEIFRRIYSLLYLQTRIDRGEGKNWHRQVNCHETVLWLFGRLPEGAALGASQDSYARLWAQTTRLQDMFEHEFPFGFQIKNNSLSPPYHSGVILGRDKHQDDLVVFEKEGTDLPFRLTSFKKILKEYSRILTSMRIYSGVP